jgi:hypothetical protein
MRNRSLISIIALAAALAFSSAIFAQTDTKTAAGATNKGKSNDVPVPPRDFSGVWMSTAFAKGPSPRIHERPETFLQPWALTKLNAEPMALRRDLPESHDAAGRDQDVSCSQIALTDFITKLKPIEIVQTPQRIFMFFEYEHTFREIWMDGRALPKDPDPSYFGYSVGRWEGDTLVVETVGFNDMTLINGMPHSDAAHLVERYTHPNRDTLELTMKADDSKAYTKPWTAGPVELVWHPDWQLEEEFCIQEDNATFKKAFIDPGRPPRSAPNGNNGGNKSNQK